MSTTRLHTIDDLLAMSDSDRYELIEGELFEVSPSGIESSAIGIVISTMIQVFVWEHNLGYVTGSAGGFILESNPDTVVAPDVGFIRRERYPDGLPHRGLAATPPDLAVEVLSPSDEPNQIRRKQGLYEKAGVPIVWWVNPADATVTVHRANQRVITLSLEDELDGGDVLPGFSLRLADIFEN